MYTIFARIRDLCTPNAAALSTATRLISGSFSRQFPDTAMRGACASQSFDGRPAGAGRRSNRDRKPNKPACDSVPAETWYSEESKAIAATIIAMEQDIRAMVENFSDPIKHSYLKLLDAVLAVPGTSNQASCIEALHITVLDALQKNTLASQQSPL